VPVLQSYFLEALSLAAATSLSYFNHTRTRRSSSLLLIFWPLYTVGLSAWIRTILACDFEYYQLVLALKSFVAGVGFITFVLETLGPEYDLIPALGDKSHTENPVITANIFSIWVSLSC
jgi:ATP-binding cassette subfamily C (CFTR/MRP) protein 1